MTHHAIIRKRATAVNVAITPPADARVIDRLRPLTLRGSYFVLPPYSSRWTRMKWSVKAVWAIALLLLGMWHPMQPWAESIGHIDGLPCRVVMVALRDRFVVAAERE
jgi:hypothetical protein